jgi:uncharacterized protein involved in type VI secretion and phage assembly
MSSDILRLLTAPPPGRERIYGVVVGIVTDNKDPEDLYRVKIRFPWLDDPNESRWARVATAMAGDKRGSYFLPEVGDEVLVAFEHGAIDFPYVVGSLWNGKDKPPESNSDGQNKHRTLHSRSGHVIRFVDASGGERIEIIDKTGNNSIVIDSVKNTVTIKSQSDITITSSTGRLKMSAMGIDIKSQTDIAIKAGTTMDAQASAVMTLKGAMIKLN